MSAASTTREATTMRPKYRVTYPLITRDGFRDFDTLEEATAFVVARRNADLHGWRHINVELVEVQS